MGSFLETYNDYIVAGRSVSLVLYPIGHFLSILFKETKTLKGLITSSSMHNFATKLS